MTYKELMNLIPTRNKNDSFPSLPPTHPPTKHLRDNNFKQKAARPQIWDICFGKLCYELPGINRHAKCLKMNE